MQRALMHQEVMRKTIPCTLDRGNTAPVPLWNGVAADHCIRTLLELFIQASAPAGTDARPSACKVCGRCKDEPRPVQDGAAGEFLNF